MRVRLLTSVVVISLVTLTASILGFDQPSLFLSSGGNLAEAGPSPKGPPQGPRTSGPIESLADRNRNKILDNLESRLPALAFDAHLDVIVQFESPLADIDFPGLQRDIGPFAVRSTYRSIDAIATTWTRGQVEAASRRGIVKMIELDGQVQLFNDSATQTFAVDEARLDFSVDGNADGSSAYSKDDVVIAIVDTGIYAAHRDLDSGKVIGWRDEVNGLPSPYDDQGHGTHVASIAAGTGAARADKKYEGVAPGAALVGVKVLDSSGSGTIAQVDNGIQWVIDHKTEFGIEILSMSLGIAGCADGTDSTSRLVNAAVTAGIVVTVAAGNEGPLECTVGSPAAATGAITAGALADPGELGVYLTYFSSRGPTADGRKKPDVLSPGWQITAAQAGTTNGYVSLSGTSMSTPFVAGVAALVLDASPGMTPAAVKSLLMNTADDFGLAGLDNESGAGVIDPYEALDQVSPLSPARSTFLPPRYQVAGALNGFNDVDLILIDVVDASKPLAITMTVLDTSSFDAFYYLFFGCVQPDFDLYLYAPGVNPNTGTPVASSAECWRHEQIGYQPTTPGQYTLKVVSWDGSSLFPNFTDGAGPYVLDISGGTSSGPSGTPTPTPTSTLTPTPTFTPTPTPTLTPTPTATPALAACAAPSITSSSDTKPFGAGTVSFSWTSVTGAAQYTVQRQRSNGSWQTRQVSSATSFTGGDLSNDPLWRVYVSSVASGSPCSAPGATTAFDP